jgi:hypothetical protein
VEGERVVVVLSWDDFVCLLQRREQTDEDK